MYNKRKIGLLKKLVQKSVNLRQIKTVVYVILAMKFSAKG